MIDIEPDHAERDKVKGRTRRYQYGILSAICGLVIGLYAYTARTSYLTSSRFDGADDYYNLMVQGFRAGQLNLKKEVPAGLAKLQDPYDPEANARYPVLDTSYYNGKLYLYFGVTPALLLFWPYVAVTGRFLLQKDAAVVFCAVGFLVSAALLWALWRRYFPAVSIWIVAAGTLALGLSTGTLSLLARCDVHEVAICCSYSLMMLTLALIWKTIHDESRQRYYWLAAASLMYGLAVGARPSLLFGAIILLLPVLPMWRERRKAFISVMAVTAPILLIGIGLMIYNARRFDDPFEFGLRYQLTAVRLVDAPLFGPHFLWFNLRVFFWEPARWSFRFPYVHDIVIPSIPVGHAGVDHPFGILTNTPVVWSVVAVPLVWRNRSLISQSNLYMYLGVLALLFGICALTDCFFTGANFRYEVDFLPTLLLLATIGVLGLGRKLSDQPIWRRTLYSVWGLLLIYSVVFNLFASVGRCAEAHLNMGIVLQRQGNMEHALTEYKNAIRLNSDFAEARYHLGAALGQTGDLEGALEQYEQALGLLPSYAEAQNNLGSVLMQLGRFESAIRHYQQALRLKPEFAEANNNLGLAEEQMNRPEEARRQYEQALRFKPDLAEAHNNLGAILARMGRPEEAIQHLEQAVQLRPEFAEAHNHLGLALYQTGQTEVAMKHFQEAVRLKPNFAEAHNFLGVVLHRQGHTQEAMEHYEQALLLRPDFAEAHYNLGVSLQQTGRIDDAVKQYEQALHFRPDFPEAKSRLAQLQPVFR